MLEDQADSDQDSCEVNKYLDNKSNNFQIYDFLGEEEEESNRRNSSHMESEEAVVSKKERNKVIETEDASRGPLSGCIRLADSSRVIQRLKVRKQLLALITVP